MLISMTGFGSASSSERGFLISSEIKAVNNRFLKTTIKLPDGFASLETKIDELLRSRLIRGSVNCSIKLERVEQQNDLEIDYDALRRYVDEKKNFEEKFPECAVFSGVGYFVDFLRLPGVIRDKSASERENLPETLWNAVAQNISEALGRLQEMRKTEGEATAKYLAGNLEQLRVSIGEIKELAPRVVENYREKLGERVGKALAEKGATLDPVDLIREVAVYTDKVDISEEISRFYSHLAQFEKTMNGESACGKKLDFLTQEMFRETNTIGSKANSPDVLKLVVEMKSTIERIREMVQNVE